MDVPSAVLGLVLFAAAVGGLAILWASPTWGVVRHGYEILLAGTLGLMALGAWGAMRGPIASLEGVESSALWAQRGLLATAVLTLVAVALIAVRAPTVGRVTGIVGTLVGIATFWPVAALRAASAVPPDSTVVGVLEIALGGFFLGAVWDGMILGHWYLVERRLSNRYMVWISWVNVAAVAAGAASVALSARNPVPCEGLTGEAAALCSFTYSPILSIGSFTIIMGIGLMALVALISGFNVKLAREGGRSIQASTGMYYLAVILAPAAEFAAKIRFY